MEMVDQAAIPGVHRVIRRLGADEGPYPGDLVAHGDGVAVLLAADAEAVRWEFAGAEHVAAPLEVLRAPTGNAVLLPWCTRRLGALVAQRRAAVDPPDAGECVTLAVSLLRGIGELSGADVTGTWWVTVDGRPVVVPGGDRRAREEAAEVLASLGDASTERTLKRMLVEIGECVAERAPSEAQRGQWEDSLCEYAAPRALRTEVFAPADASIARTLRPAPTLRRRDRRAGRSVTGLHAAAERARAVGTAVLERVRSFESRRSARAGESRASGRVGGRATPGRGRADERAQRPSGPRRMIVAGVAAAAVLLVGVLWPDGGSDPAEAGETAAHGVIGAVGDAEPTADPPHTQDAAARSDSSEAAPDSAVPEEASDGATSAQTDPVAAASTVIRGLLACLATGDAQCGAVVAEDANVDLAVVDGAAAEPAELVDDYGDVAVVRVGVDEAERMLVLIRRNDVWLVRAVMDVADQPDGSD